MRYIVGGLIVGAVIGICAALAQVVMWLVSGVLRAAWCALSVLGSLAWRSARKALVGRRAHRLHSAAEIGLAADDEWQKHVTV